MDKDAYCASLKKALQERGILVRRLVSAPYFDASFWFRHPNGHTVTWHLRGTGALEADVAAIVAQLEAPQAQRQPEPTADAWEWMED